MQCIDMRRHVATCSEKQNYEKSKGMKYYLSINLRKYNNKYLLYNQPKVHIYICMHS